MFSWDKTSVVGPPCRYLDFSYILFSFEFIANKFYCWCICTKQSCDGSEAPFRPDCLLNNFRFLLRRQSRFVSSVVPLRFIMLKPVPSMCLQASNLSNSFIWKFSKLQIFDQFSIALVLLGTVGETERDQSVINRISSTFPPRYQMSRRIILLCSLETKSSRSWERSNLYLNPSSLLSFCLIDWKCINSTLSF